MLTYVEHPLVDPTARTLILVIEILLFSYCVVSNGFYLWTAAVSLRQLPAFIKRHRASPPRAADSRLVMPVSVIVPVFNESEHAVTTVRSLLRFTYPAYEVIVVNDGSTDDTLDVLHAAFDLEPSSEPYHSAIFPTEPVRAIYRSHSVPSVCVVDKENGGKSDALNTGINCCSYPLLFCVDGDSFYVPEALARMAEPFLSDERTVGTAASIGVANGCEFRDGTLTNVRISRNPIAAFQVLEYLRAFLVSRVGWAHVNGLNIMSGACAMYRKDVVIEVGGFRTDTIWEDLEMTIRVHHFMCAARRPYRIAFTPFTVCWTKVPETLRELCKQRVGWQRHLSEAVALHRRLLFRPRGGAIGWVSFPNLLLCEWFAPLAVLFGLTFGAVGLYLGFLSIWSQVALLLLVVGLGLPVSIVAIVLDEMSFATYRFGDVGRLLLCAVAENAGFRQLMTFANLVGTGAWAFRRRTRSRRLLGPLAPGYDPARSPRWRTASGTAAHARDQRRF